MSTISGKSIYAQVHRPNQFDAYQIILAMDKESAQKLKDQGVKPQNASTFELKDGSTADQFGEFIHRFKQKAEGKTGSFPPPRVVIEEDGELVDFDEDIGNGSDVVVQYKIGEWTFKGRKGKTAYLEAVKVVNHIPYERPPKTLEFDKESARSEDGFDDDVI